MLNGSQEIALLKAEAELYNVGLPSYLRLLALLGESVEFMRGFYDDEDNERIVAPLVDAADAMLKQAPEMVYYNGLYYRVLAKFPDDQIDRANRYINQHPNAAVLMVRDGIAYLSDIADVGVKL